MKIPSVITGKESIEDATNPYHALVEFYAAFNGADMIKMEQNWANEASVIMANPLGGIKTGWRQIRPVYERIFARPQQVYVEYYDITICNTAEQFFAVGRERGYFKDRAGTQIPLNIRTSRVFQNRNGQWRQVHHHGSMDNPELLARYQQEVQRG